MAGSWKTAESAPKDGRTFFAIKFYSSFEDSLHWCLYWNGENFEATNKGDEVVDYFTHWMIPAGPK